MKNRRRSILWLALLAPFGFNFQAPMAGGGEPTLRASAAGPGAAALKPAGANNLQVIPWDQLGAKAGADYQGDGLTVTPNAGGARLHCVFQQLDGEATANGLWLTSTVTNQADDRFQVKAMSVGRGADASPLSAMGTVLVDRQMVRFDRPGLMERYTVSVDGVQQEFVVMNPPAGRGELKVSLGVTGARVAATAYGAQLVLPHSGRKIGYSRLRVTDAGGKELSAKVEVEPGGSVAAMVVVVNDAGAVYPVQIDPTFSDASWISLGGAIDGDVTATVTDGRGNLYIGGGFTIVGDAIANRIAKWNGSGWSALGSGVDSDVDALAVSGNTVYAGGLFTMAGGVAANYIAEWNGSNWLAMGSGMSNPLTPWGTRMQPCVRALAVSGNTVYAGGQFSTAGGMLATNIAQWNGSGWLSLGSGTDGDVDALAVSGNIVYVGGDFEAAGDVAANYIAQWDGSSWSPLGAGMDSDVDALAVSGGTLYAGGCFTMAGEVAASGVAQWDGSSWTALGLGMGGMLGGVEALAASGNTLYAGGWFTMAGGVAATNVAQWDGSRWSPLGAGIYRPVYALAVSGETLYAGSELMEAEPDHPIAKWNGSSWSALDSGLNSRVYALVVASNTLYAGGWFTAAGGVAANSVARWNGSGWSALGPGIGGDSLPWVCALAAAGSTLYAGGSFTTAGGVAATNIAKWDGNRWSSLGLGMNSQVTALAVLGNTLYAGGGFVVVDGQGGFDGLAKWDGNHWSPLDLGIGGGYFPCVNALTASGGTLYVGGSFTMVGGVVASNIARWDGSSWSPLGSGINGQVDAVAVSASTVYAGGSFTTAGGVAAANIAKWDGSSWSPLGAGMDYPVYALAVADDELYAGGLFSRVGDMQAFGIAEWDGNSWSTPSKGLGYYDSVGVVYALAAAGDRLYVGGEFTTVGGLASTYATEAMLTWPEFRGEPAGSANGNITLNLLTLTNCQSRVYAAANLTPPITWLPLGTNLNGGTWQFIDTNSAGCENKFYRVSTP
jgi:hypothetical protein